MIGPDQLAAIIANPVETTEVEFKAQLDWKDRATKLELARDIACLANRDGGYIIVGVKQLADHSFQAAGLDEGEAMPDVTALNQFVQEYFDPPIPSLVRTITLDERRFGVIEVPRFDRMPHICQRDGNDAGSRSILRDGDLLRRTDAMSCQTVRARDMRGLIDSAVAATGAALRNLVTSPSPRAPTEAERGPRHLVAPPISAPRLAKYATLRAADLEPLEAVPAQRLRDLEDALRNAAVSARYGGVYIPRNFELVSSDEGILIREPGRVIFEGERSLRGLDEEVRAVIGVAELDANLRARIRESLWEDARPAVGSMRIDIVSVVAFAVGALQFGSRIYRAAGIDGFRCSIGVLSPLGRTLWLEPGPFMPLMQTYRATTASDLWVTRDVAVSNVSEVTILEAIAEDMVTELLDYFGMRLMDGAWANALRRAHETILMSGDL